MRYKGFISYSHRDAEWGTWLHKGLETYRVPGSLVGTEGRHGTITSRLGTFFRDREELPTSHDLGTMITEALRESEFLIVICSPDSAKSLWVNQEIKDFKRLHGPGKVLAIVIRGEPNATDRGNPDAECFPPALRFEVDTEGELTETRCEPIAADARPESDGRKRAFLKLVAGLLGLNFDSLVQREKQRQRQRLLVSSASSAIVLAIIAYLAVGLVQQRLQTVEARAGQERAEGATEQLVGTVLIEGWDVPDFVRAAVLNDIDSLESTFDPAKVNDRYGPDSLTPLMIVCRAGHVEAAAWLLDHGADPEKTDKNGEMAVHHAASAGKAKIFDLFAARKLDIDQWSENGMPERPIDVAANEDHYLVVEKLLKLGVPIEVPEARESPPYVYSSPLFWAGWSGSMRTIRLLLDAGARTDITSNGRTPFETASQNGKHEAARMIAGTTGTTGAPTAVDREVASKLLKDTVMLGFMDSTEGKDIVTTVRTLISQGADVNYAGPDTRTVLDLAVSHALLFGHSDAPGREKNRSNYLAIVKLLLDAGASPNIKTMMGPLLHVVAGQADYEVLKLLVDAGADLTVTDEYGHTAIKAATDGRSYYVGLRQRNANKTPDELNAEADAAVKRCVELLLRASATEGDGGAAASNKADLAAAASLNSAFNTMNPRDLTNAVQLVRSMKNPDTVDEKSGMTPLGFWIYRSAKVVGRVDDPTGNPSEWDRDCATFATAVIEALLAKGADPNGQFKRFVEPEALIFAALESPTILKMLLDAGAKCEVKDISGRSPVELAIGRDTAVLQILLEAKADPNFPDKREFHAYDNPFLHQVIQQGKSAAAALLVKHGYDITRKVPNGALALAYAIEADQPTVIQAMLDVGMKPDVGLVEGERPAIIVAAAKNRPVILQMLIDSVEKPDLNAHLDGDGTALEYAVKNKAHECVTVLLKAGVDPNHQSTRFDFGPDVNSRRPKEKTRTNTPILIEAITVRDLISTGILIAAGADVSVVHNDVTPLIAAIKARSPELVKLLLEAKADPNQLKETGNAAIVWAIIYGKLDIMQLVIDGGADLTVTDGQGQTLRQIAQGRFNYSSKEFKYLNERLK